MKGLQQKQHQLVEFFRSHYFESIHAVKAMIAMLIGYIAYALIPQQNLMPQWILITIAVIMSSHSALGAQVSRSIYRLWGTLAGALLAAIALFTPWHAVTLPIFLLICTGIFIFFAVSYAKYNTVGTLGTATFIIITMTTHPSLSLAYERTSEIILGIVISLLVSRFILPIRSVRLIKERCFINLSRITELYQLVLLNGKKRFEDNDVIRLEAKIIENLTLQRQLQAQMKYETKKGNLNVKNIQLIIRHQTALYRYFNVLEIANRILLETLHPSETIFVLEKKFVQELVLFLTGFIQNYPHLSEEHFITMQEKCNELLYNTHLKSMSDPLLPPLHTLCFINSRINIACQKLASHIRIEYEEKS